MSNSPVLVMRSGENQLWVMAWWWAFWFWWVAIYDKEDEKGKPITPIALQTWYNQWFTLPYDSVAIIIVNDTVRWTNNVLLPYPKDQIVRERGRFDLRIFRSAAMEKFIDEYRQQLLNLWINIR
jgi:hypothetical protein